MNHAARNPQSAIRNPQSDVAIIGMACMFPGAPNLDTFWQNIVSKVDAITDPPPEAWDSDIFYDPESTENDRVYCKRGGYLGPLAYFNPLEHGVMPRTVEGGEPDQWLALQVAHDALTDAGYLDQPKEKHRTAVILGKGTYINRGNLAMVQHSLMVDQTLQVLKTLHPEFTDEDLRLIRQDLKRHLPPFNAETASAMVPNIIAGRIANRLDLMGPSYTVDAACASSLIAVEDAVRGLVNGEYDLALAGGAQVTTPIPILTLFCQLKALSFQQQIRPFDKDADGTILGEGLGMVVLKRLEDAVRDGDRIYAVIKGIGVASDGRALSVMAPRVDGEELALRRAYEQAGISPRTVGLIEAHGTATPVGDAAEVQALTRVFGSRNDSEIRNPKSEIHKWCALGTIKSMIGHAMPAAGVAGLIKTALALYHKVLPPTLNVDQPNPRLELEKTPFYINTETRPWIHSGHDGPRRAGVNAFGFGGINAHVILEEHLVPDEAVLPSHHLHWDAEVCILQAESRDDLIRQGEQLARFLETDRDISLKDLAYTLNVKRENVKRETCLAIVASSLQDLQRKLDRALKRLADPACRKIKTRDGIYFFEEPLGREGKLAFLFPGEGAQYVNMLADLCFHFPEVRRCFDETDAVYADHARGYVPSDFIFPRPAFSEEERREAQTRLWQMDVAIEALLTANHALYRLLSHLGIRPDAMLGHSTGEYSAMRAVGMLGDEALFGQRLRELNRLYERVVAQGAIPEATLVAVGGSREQVTALIEQTGGDLYVAMDNCPHQAVMVGNADNIGAVVELARRHGLVYEVLPFDRAYHTPLFKPYAEVLREFLASWIVAAPKVPLYSCTTSALYPSDLAEIRRTAFEHWVRPVEFSKTIEAMYADGVRVFVEVGPRGNLTTFVDDILREQPHLAVPANVMRRSGITQLNHLVGLLAAHGVPMRLEHLYARRAPQKLALDQPTDPTGKGKKSAGLKKLTTGWPPMGISEETAARVRETTADHRSPTVATTADGDTASSHLATQPSSHPVHPSGHSAPQPSGAAQVMSAYLQTMERFLEVQQGVMEAYLATTGDRPLTAVPVQRDERTEEQKSIGAPAHLGLAAGQDEPRIVVSSEHQQSEAPPAVEGESSVSQATPALPQSPQQRLRCPSLKSLSSATIEQVLLRLVSERTGYPTEMLDLNLDLEADLGIDSIKRVEILGAFQQEMGVHLGEKMEQVSAQRTLQGMIKLLETDDGGRTVDDGRWTTDDSDVQSPKQRLRCPNLPFIQEVLSLTPGQALEARCEISLDRYPFLRDHTLGRAVSVTDPELTGLPVMPLTMSMEMLAEAAQLLVPDKVLIGMKDVRAYRWIAPENERLALKLVATATTAITISERPAASAADIPPLSGHEVHVQIYHADSSVEGQAHTATPIVEGIMVFDEAYPEPPAVGDFSLWGERPSKWAPERLYKDGMFHGPAFRGVVSMDCWGEDGAKATLEVLPLEGLFASGPSRTLLTDPVLLDQPGQVVAFWMAEHLERGYVIFPFRLDALYLYGPILPPHEQVKCLARIALIGDWQVRSDLDIVREDGRVWARFAGWEDRRFDVPRDFFRFLLSPPDVVLSQPWPTAVASLSEPERFQACRLSLQSFPEGFFTAYSSIWQRVLAHAVLSRRERELWRSLGMPTRRRLEWLLGRLTAKDAVRRFLKQRYALTLCPADIVILPDDNGRPVAQGAWTDQVPCVPHLSLSHTAGVAVAVVGDCDTEVGVGVDIEHVGRMNEDVETLAFTPHERELLSSVHDGGQDGWPLRFWCAKEAVAKALGHGMIGGPQGLVVQGVDVGSGRVEVSLSGELARRCRADDGLSLQAFTAREGDLIVAISLFSDDR